MFHQKISLPENHSDYPSTWTSDCGRFRIIRCTDDIQWIVQAYRTPKWRSVSYHTEWSSIHMRWGGEAPFATLTQKQLYAFK